MSITSTLSEKLPTIKTPSAASAVYAVVGAGDYVVEAVRTAEPPKVDFDADAILRDLRTLQGQAMAIRLSGLPKQIKRINLADLQEQARSLQNQLKSVQGQAQHTALDVAGQAGVVYADLAKRGEGVVGRLRGIDVDVVVKDTASGGSGTSTASKSTAKKSAAKKSTAKKSAAKKSTTGRSTSARTSTAKKAGAAAKKNTATAKGSTTRARNNATSAAKTARTAAKNTGTAASKSAEAAKDSAAATASNAAADASRAVDNAADRAVDNS